MREVAIYLFFCGSRNIAEIIVAFQVYSIVDYFNRLIPPQAPYILVSFHKL